MELSNTNSARYTRNFPLQIIHLYLLALSRGGVHDGQRLEDLTYSEAKALCDGYDARTQNYAEESASLASFCERLAQVQNSSIKALCDDCVISDIIGTGDALFSRSDGGNKLLRLRSEQ